MGPQAGKMRRGAGGTQVLESISGGSFGKKSIIASMIFDEILEGGFGWFFDGFVSYL